MSEDNKQQPAITELTALYEHNTRLAEAFWEWQHKSLTLFTTGIGALLAIEAWCYDRDFGRWLAVPTAAACLLSVLCVGMAFRNRRILRAAYARGAELEGLLREGLPLQQSSIFQWLAFESPAFYRTWLPRAFGAAAVLALVATVSVLEWPPHRTPSHHAAANVRVQRH